MASLRGLFSSSVRQNMRDGAPQGRAPDGQMITGPPQLDGNPEHRYLGGLVKYQRPEGQTSADRMALFGATLSDVGSRLAGRDAGSLDRVQAGFRKRALEAQQQSQLAELTALAQTLYPNDAEAQLLFRADPESFVKARSERFKPQVMSGGQTYDDPLSGRRFTAPVVGKFDDRYGAYDPETNEATFSAPRGPTYSEGTSRLSQEETERHNREAEAVDRGQLSVSQGGLGLSRDRFRFERQGGGLGVATPVRTPAELAALPPGSLYVGPDGQTRRKP